MANRGVVAAVCGTVVIGMILLLTMFNIATVQAPVEEVFRKAEAMDVRVTQQSVFLSESGHAPRISVIKLSNPARAVEELERKVGVRVEIIDPLAPEYRPNYLMRDCFNGLQFLAEETHGLFLAENEPDDGVLEVIQFALKFNPATVATQGMPVDIRFVAVDAMTDFYGGAYAMYSFYKNPAHGMPQESITWFDTTLLVSPDFFAVLWAHELTHLLTLRVLMRERNLSTGQAVDLFVADYALQTALEDKAWRITVKFYNLFMRNGVFQKRLKRPPMDIRLWWELAGASEAYAMGGEIWKQFVRNRTHRPGVSK